LSTGEAVMAAPLLGFVEFTVSTQVTMAGAVGAGALLLLHPSRVKTRRIAILVRLSSLRMEVPSPFRLVLIDVRGTGLCW
jgi:hypothetical protein